MEDIRLITTYMSVIGAALGWFWGGGTPALYTLIVFMAIDYISGVMLAIVNKEVSSAVGARGIFKKMMIMAFVGMGHLLDAYAMGQGQMLQTAIIFFYMSNEGISILENTTELGLPIPQKLKDILVQLNKK